MKSRFSLYLLLILPFLCFILGYGICNVFIGNKSYPAPNLVGKSLHEAMAQTSPFHINIQLAAEKECPGVAHGTIINQKPAAGRLVKSHQSIVVVTCKQTECPIAPNLYGLNAAQAQELCLQQKIKLKTYPVASQLPGGSIIGQNPLAGLTVSDKKIVAYIAHEQPNLYLMPQLINNSLDTVIDFLQKHEIAYELFWQCQRLEPHDLAQLPENLIITAQKPTAGSLVPLHKNLLVQLEIA
jgi:eukaryotic-like serine/threonine-protein kinase